VNLTAIEQQDGSDVVVCRPQVSSLETAIENTMRA
jgi:hypothetical protein